ncbi:MAG: hypothetical protein HQ478_06585 [Chloroflexi bacterium]|nr:hypothetical protein [Chloroflexota bacterium]
MRTFQAIFGALTVAVIGLLLWPIFSAGEPQLPIALAIFLVVGALLVAIGLRSKRRWSRYALLGILPGFLIGGFGLGSLVWFGSGTGGTGWDGIVAVAAGILGAFVGAILGAVIGGLIGVRRDRGDRRSGRR